MANAVTSFAELSLKAAAVRTADNSDFEFEFPASGRQATPSVLTTPLEHARQRLRDPVAEIEGWSHGGIDE